MLISADAALYFRRGLTHGVLAMLVLPVLLTGAIYLWHRWRGGGSTQQAEIQQAETQQAQLPFRPGAILLLAFLGVCSHPLLDWLNTYGVRLLMPFDGTWFYGDTLFIIDPWMWLLTAAGIVLAHSRSRKALSGWAILLAITSGLVLGIGFVSGGVKLLWVVGITAIVLLLPQSGIHRQASLVARGGMTLLLLYIGTAYLLAREAESLLSAQYPHASVVQANPVPGNPTAHRLLVVEEDQYRIVSPAREDLQLPRQAADATVQQALASPTLRGFSNWMRFPYWQTEASEDGWIVNFWDLRYQEPGQPAITGVGFARVVVPK